MTIQEQLAALPVGTRVRLTAPVEAYPVVLVEEGESGTVAAHEHDCSWILLDRYFPELAEWQNRLQLWHWPKEADSEVIALLPLARLPEGMRACRFAFDMSETTFPGFAHGTTWNGFANVSVTPETLALITSEDGPIDPENAADLRLLPIGPDGLVSLANGYTTTLVEVSRPYTWLDASAALRPGNRVQLVQDWTWPNGEPIDSGTEGTVVENGLNEIWATLLVRFDGATENLALAGPDSALDPDQPDSPWQDGCPVAPMAVEAVEAPSGPALNADSLGVAEAVREAVACVLQSTLAPARRDAVASSLQALLAQRGCQGVPMGPDRLTDACDEAIFG